jgi:hypothetical protein
MCLVQWAVMHRSCVVIWTHAWNMEVELVHSFYISSGWYHGPRRLQQVYCCEILVIRVLACARCDITKDGRFCTSETLVSKILCHLPGCTERSLHFSEMLLSLFKTCENQYSSFMQKM